MNEANKALLKDIKELKEQLQLGAIAEFWLI